MVLFIGTLLLICIALPPMLGTDMAENLIKGDAQSFEVKLNLIDKNIDLSNKTFILVTHSDSKYYLIEKNESMPQNVKIYIIPDDQIKVVTVKPFEGTQRPIYESYKDWRF